MKTDTPDTVDTAENGNTKVILRARIWGFTWNNYRPEEFEELKEWCKEQRAKDYAVNEETGETGTRHLQGHIEFTNARTFSSLKKRWNKAHWEVVRNKEAHAKYCRKPETRTGECFTKEPKVKSPLQGKILKPWQETIVKLMCEEPEERIVYWFHDKKGGQGKTSLAKHLCINYQGQVLYICGKANDVKYGISSFIQEDENNLKMCIFDFVRSSENFVSYQAIEEVKNGIFYNTKYESKMVVFNTPHVVIFSNFPPDLTKLSADRWRVTDLNIENGGDVFESGSELDELDDLIG